MIRSIVKASTVGLGLLVGSLFVGSSSAQATLFLQIRDNAVLVGSFTDGGTGTILVPPTFPPNPFGGFFIAAIANSNSSPVAPFATISLDVTAILLDNAAHTLEFTFFEDNFTFPSFAGAVLGLESGVSGLSDGIPTGSFQSIAAGTLATPLQPFSGVAFADTKFGTFSPPGLPYELRGVLTINFPAGSLGSSFTITAQNSVTAVVPEPGTYVLVGMGLTYLGVGYGWRRRKARLAG